MTMSTKLQPALLLIYNEEDGAGIGLGIVMGGEGKEIRGDPTFSGGELQFGADPGQELRGAEKSPGFRGARDS